MNKLEWEPEALIVSVISQHDDPIEKKELYSVDTITSDMILYIKDIAAEKNKIDADTEITTRLYTFINELYLWPLNAAPIKIPRSFSLIVCLIFCSIVSGATNPEIAQRIYHVLIHHNHIQPMKMT